MTTEVLVWCSSHTEEIICWEGLSYILTAGLFSWMLNCNLSDSRNKLKCRNWKIHNKEWRFNKRWKPSWRSKHPKRQETKKLAIKIIQIISTVQYSENKRAHEDQEETGWRQEDRRDVRTRERHRLTTNWSNEGRSCRWRDAGSRGC